jgi:hypothetical protein
LTLVVPYQQSESPRRKTASNDRQLPDVDDNFLVAVECMKMRWGMIGKIHPDDDAVKTT